MKRKHEDGTEVDLTLVTEGPKTPTAEHPILVNAAQCTECGQVLVSMTTHDFRQCDCPNEVFVDGGREYLRRGFKNSAPFDMSISLNPDTGNFYRTESGPV